MIVIVIIALSSIMLESLVAMEDIVVGGGVNACGDVQAEFELRRGDGSVVTASTGSAPNLNNVFFKFEIN
ncbi:hypothetical protein ERO13_A13G161414v2 [Gossypium hirsutum]|uniref:Uncharacterized protein n=3 Tax=Gossypium TaxID=3633 RepID=A0A5J5T4V8_GOSBA|nr:hypothetical protein ES319_A13G186500v1 [Gossypium barbadense]KAG4166994.1 hypothetical protein ERO13_A13G161414v2 [Gossypium hirsutum]TYG87253.1 hypothetical protein ES288_A13G199000v1 [Gossypium darwinii]TYH92719.1 hypothetical protein ES332_A13G202400v1 [Gossypium tomentosum]